MMANAAVAAEVGNEHGHFEVSSVTLDHMMQHGAGPSTVRRVNAAKMRRRAEWASAGPLMNSTSATAGVQDDHDDDALPCPKFNKMDIELHGRFTLMEILCNCCILLYHRNCIGCLYCLKNYELCVVAWTCSAAATRRCSSSWTARCSRAPPCTCWMPSGMALHGSQHLLFR